jgi:hypothetical protein
LPAADLGPSPRPMRAERGSSLVLGEEPTRTPTFV